MTDTGFGRDEKRNTGGRENGTAITRHPDVTDSFDSVFDVLSVARRRYLLYHLFRMEGDVAELDDAVDAVRQYGAAGPDETERPDRETVRIDLHHVHLPKLAEAGVLDFDRRQGTIRMRGSPLLEELVEHAYHKELN
jgi:hypothetical protein